MGRGSLVRTFASKPSFSNSSLGEDEKERLKLSASSPIYQRWFCEACLWLKWCHVGHMAATTYTELVELDSTLFQAEFATEAFLVCYAHQFMRYLRQEPAQTGDVMNLQSTFDHLEFLVKAAERGINVSQVEVVMSTNASNQSDLIDTRGSLDDDAVDLESN